MGQSLDQEDSPGGENGNPLQYSCPDNSTERGTWRATRLQGCKESDTAEHSTQAGYYPRPYIQATAPSLPVGGSRKPVTLCLENTSTKTRGIEPPSLHVGPSFPFPVGQLGQEFEPGQLSPHFSRYLSHIKSSWEGICAKNRPLFIYWSQLQPSPSRACCGRKLI